MLSRRESLGLFGTMGIAATGGGLLDPLLVHRQDAAAPLAFAGKHEPTALPFDPKALKGLSEKLLVSHHDNNYAGAVRNLNKVEAELARVTKDTPAFVVAGLAQSQLQYTNSMLLHETYFANLGGTGAASGPIVEQLTVRYGSLARWEELFRASGASLGGGSGWVVLAYDVARDTLTTSWSGQHTQALAAGVPLLVLDMYEHAYQMDYGAAAAKYIDAFFVNLRWDSVNQRLERSIKAAAAMRG